MSEAIARHGPGVHPAAELFPLLPDNELRALAGSIKASGLRQPIILADGLILDGRNRMRACELAGVEPTFAQFSGGNPWQYVWDLNAERRHLEPFQKAALAVKFAAHSDAWREEQESRRAQANKARTESRGPGGKIQPKHRAGSTEPRRQSEDIASKARVSPASIKRAQELQRKAPEVFEAVCRGEVRGRQALTEVQRAERLAEIARVPPAAIGSIPDCPVLLADPPWRYEHTESENRAIENQYPTMDLDAICALRPPAAQDAVLFLWATSPKLEEALRALNAWGFSYRTCAVWVKDKIGMGYWFRQQHELLLVGVRGSLPPPPSDLRVSSVITSERTAHSAKPEEVPALIERAYPTLPRVELFARKPRTGWHVWGNEVSA